MSKRPTSTAIKPEALFSAASFANLRAAAGEGAGEPLHLSLADIDEDPEQPRRDIDPGELQSLAESIRYRGVLQPIGVRPAIDGRYALVFGARRLRAAKIAGKSEIPALVVHETQRDFATQVIENQQRANLSNAEVAGAVNRLFADGVSNKEIQAICNLKDWQLAAYRAVASFPQFLIARLSSGELRALYDLFRQWKHTPSEIEASMPDPETYLTVTEARRIISHITGKSTGSIVIAREEQSEPAPTQQKQAAAEEPGELPTQAKANSAKRTWATEDELIAEPVEQTTIEHGDVIEASMGVRERSPAREPAPGSVVKAVADHSTGALTFYVACNDGERGRLVLNRKAESEGWVLVAYDNAVEEVEARHLRIVSVGD